MPAMAVAQTAPGQTLQNAQEFLERTAKDPAFAGAEAPRPPDGAKGADRSRSGDANDYSPTKILEEKTQQAEEPPKP